MKSEIYSIENIESSLKELLFYSNFIDYTQQKYDKKDLRKKLKKLIKKVETEDPSEYLSEEGQEIIENL